MQAFFAEALWLNAARVRAYAAMLALALLAMLVVNFLKVPQTGSDFQAFWSAAHILADRGPVAVFDLDLQEQVQAEAGFGEMIAYVNPPPFLLTIFWLGVLPFGAAWIAWTGATFAVWFGAMHRAYRGDLTLPLLAFPASYLAAAHAQNGFLTGALLAGAVLALRRSPWLCGILLGMLIIKPHLALLAPFWLLARGEWKAIAGGVIGAAGMIALSLVFYGPQSWLAYPQAFEVSRQLMAQGPGLFWLRMTTPYAMLRYWATPEAAMVVQGAITLALLAITMIFARRTRDGQASGALMLAATAVASPYLFSYDLPFLAVPVFWLIMDGRARGWRPYEKLLVAGLYLSPLATRAAALPLEINLMPLPALAMVALIWNRGLTQGAQVPGDWRPKSLAFGGLPA
ncbi:MAG: DUF2029 domain-containing protein [Porphyrobacter sp.]|nr:DUF2029 domain-containing protein [Porphyrobacter sp.]